MVMDEERDTKQSTDNADSTEAGDAVGGALATDAINAPAASPKAETVDEKAVWAALGEVIDPELGWDIVSIGLVYDVFIADGSVQVVMTLTTQGCPMGDSITYGVRQAVSEVPGVNNVSVDLVWSPRWDPMMMSEEAQEAFHVRG